MEMPTNLSRATLNSANEIAMSYPTARLDGGHACENTGITSDNTIECRSAALWDTGTYGGSFCENVR